LAAANFFATTAGAHPGGLDSRGGHADHEKGGYHFHDGPKNSEGSSSGTSSATSSGAAALVSGDLPYGGLLTDDAFEVFFFERKSDLNKKLIAEWKNLTEGQRKIVLNYIAELKRPDHKRGEEAAVVKSAPNSKEQKVLYVASSKATMYHHPLCALAEKIKPTNTVRFNSKEEAVRAEYTPCKICNP